MAQETNDRRRRTSPVIPAEGDVTMGRHLFIHQEAEETAKRQIQIMERFFAAVDGDKHTSELYFELMRMYMEVLQEDLKSFGYDLAVLLFSTNRHVVDQRRALIQTEDALPTAVQKAP